MPNHKTLSTILLGVSLGLSGQAYASEEPLRGKPFLDNRDKTVSMPTEWVAKDIVHEKALRDADLVVTLNQDTYPALKDEVNRYAKANGLKIVMHSGTCGTSAGKLMNKTINSGAFCCPPGDTDRLPGLEYHTLGITAVAVIVNGKNPLDNISLDEARDIFRGKLRHWQDLDSLNALNAPIATTARLHCKTRPGHWTLLLSKQEHFSPTLKEVGVIPDLVAKVARERNAISIETPFLVKEFSKPGEVKLLKIDGRSPTDAAHVASGKYPFYRTFNMTTWSHDSGKREQTLKLIHHLRDFIEKDYQRSHLVPVSMLKAGGWKFAGDELVGEPSGEVLAHHPPAHD
jgi:ABC-type phosphate transport system substrate-binding protein